MSTSPASIENPLLAAALAYAARGWPVFPCHPGTKAPLLTADKDGDGKAIKGTGGLTKATTDPAQISAWWSRWPKALIGAPQGRNGLFVLDFDPRADDETGEVWTLERLKAELEAQMATSLPISAAAMTPSGGVHVYLAQPDGDPVRNRGNLPDHVDVRGEGGYTIVPPSVMTDGRTYRWLRPIDETPIAAAPASLIAILRWRGAPNAPEREASTAPARRAASAGDAVRKYAMAAFDGECQTLAAAPQGKRNAQINASAYLLGQLIGAGALSEAMVRAALTDIVSAWPDVDKSRGTIDSGLTAGMGQPRDLREIEASAERRAGSPARSRGGTAAALPARAASTGVSPSPDRSSPPDAPDPGPRTGGQTTPSQMGGLTGWRDSRGKGGADDDDTLDRAGAQRPHTDLGNAERWRDRHGDRFRHHKALGWLAWDGRRWSREDAETLLQHSIYDTARAIGAEADWLAQAGEAYREDFAYAEEDLFKSGRTPLADPDPLVDIKKWQRRSDKLRGWGRTSENVTRIRAVEALAMPMVAVRPDMFDRDPMKLNVLNGTLLFDRAGPECSDPVVELLPHDPADLITKLAPVMFDREAKCPVYDAFFERVQPEEDHRRLLHAWGGYNMTGDTSEQRFVIAHGATGGNGKSTWVNAVAGVLGDYASSVPVQTFLDQGSQRKGGDATPDIAELPGKRMVFASEPPRGSKLGEGLVKLITGEERMKARFLNKDFFDFMPSLKLTIVTNPKLELSDDKALWRRVIYSGWNVSIPERERDASLPKKLAAEASGILNRLIEGVVDWMSFGLSELIPASIREATEAYHDERDPLGRFLKMCVAVDPDSRVQSSDMFNVFKAWARWAGEKEWTQTGFSTAMINRGFEKKQSNNVYFLGVRMLKSVDDFTVDMPGQTWGGPPHDPPDWER